MTMPSDVVTGMSRHGMERCMTRGHDDWGGGLPRGTPAIVADTAPTTGATCSGLGCRRIIEKGELRLQVGIPGVWKGVGEAVSGFYCFQSEIGGEPCLFKTFKGDKGFKYGADQIPLAKPKSTADIGGFGALSAEHQQIVTSAVQGTYSWTTCTTVPKDRVPKTGIRRQGSEGADVNPVTTVVAAAAVAPPLPQTEPPETAPPPPQPLSAPPDLAQLSSPASAVVLTVADVDAMKGVQLKIELKKRALKQSGNKSELVKRLKASITN